MTTDISRNFDLLSTDSPFEEVQAKRRRVETMLRHPMAPGAWSKYGAAAQRPP